MKYVDSLVRSNQPSRSPRAFIQARVTISQQEYSQVQQIFDQILKNAGQLNLEQKEIFESLKETLRRFQKDWRHQPLEDAAKQALLKAALNLNPSEFEDLFVYLQHFLRRSSLQGVFEQIYLALKYSKTLSKPQNLDFVTRIYLERMAVVFDLLQPYLTAKQIAKWQQHVAGRLKRF